VNRRPRAFLVLLAVVSIALLMAAAACVPASSQSSPATAVPSAGGSAGSPDVASPVAGVVVSVQSEGLDKVRGFTLRTAPGAVLQFTLGQLDDPTAFPPGHLSEHQASAVPILVSFRREGSSLVVFHLVDAP
jgi:hypothetical protein